MKMKISFLKLFLVLTLFGFSFLKAQNKILFDASKGESAGNADWVIDADVHNLGIGNNGSYLDGNESNPQQFPTPLQATITSSTLGIYWNGALSSWAIDCVKKGYEVETLPWNGLITFGVASNPQDLSNYKAFVVDEPNLVFTTAQKTAIINYVSAGGGLFMISDHDASDRNGDGFDSPHIWNDLLTNNSIGINPFGISFDYLSFSGTFSNVANLPIDPILHGINGNVSQVKWTSGTSMTLNTAQNSSVKGVVFKTGNSGAVNVLCAYATFGLGKVVAVGDSSIPDDGTGDSGDTLYDGYLADANGNHKILLLNATDWLMLPTLNTTSFELNTLKFTIAPNPIQNRQINVVFNVLDNEKINLSLFDCLGRKVKTVFVDAKSGENSNQIEVSEVNKGIYFLKITSRFGTMSKQVLVP
jgi:hypothetical protein